MHDDTLIQRCLVRLAETIAWCGPRASSADLRGCLRTPELSPHPLAGSRAAVVDDVASSRQVALRWPGLPPAQSLTGGRLLMYEPDNNLACGAALVATEGFFDENNLPPWDTWVWYVDNPDTREDYLVTWVPPALLDIAQAGIDVNPESCIRWLDEAGTAFALALRSTGILPGRNAHE